MIPLFVDKGPVHEPATPTFNTEACHAYIQHKNLPARESEWMIPLFVDMGPVHEPANDYAEKLLGVRVHGNPKG